MNGGRIQNKLEVEKKYYIENLVNLELKAKELGFIKREEISEVDEYFTDINSEFIRNRTCLRLRNTNNKELELTFKGRSKDLSNAYAKLENNIQLSLSDYDKIKQLFFNLGYYSYSIVEKERQTYTKMEDSLTYNLVIDNIKDIGSFVEFEMLADFDMSEEVVCKKLDEMIENFKSFGLKEAELPYRDFVARELFNKIKSKEKLKNIILDLDDSFNIEEKASEVINCFKLLKQLKIKGINLELITKHNKKEIDLIFKNVGIENIFNNITNECKDNDKDDTIIFRDSLEYSELDLEELIRNLFYIINFI